MLAKCHLFVLTMNDASRMTFQKVPCVPIVVGSEKKHFCHLKQELHLELSTKQNYFVDKNKFFFDILPLQDVQDV